MLASLLPYAAQSIHISKVTYIFKYLSKCHQKSHRIMYHCIIKKMIQDDILSYGLKRQCRKEFRHMSQAYVICDRRSVIGADVIKYMIKYMIKYDTIPIRQYLFLLLFISFFIINDKTRFMVLNPATTAMAWNPRGVQPYVCAFHCRCLFLLLRYYFSRRFDKLVSCARNGKIFF